MSSGLIDDYCQWTGLGRNEVEDRVQHAREINAKDYFTHSSEESFYKESEFYIYDIISASDNSQQLEDKLKKFIPGLTESLRVTTGKFLDFGAGVGLMCEWMARNTKMDVHYCDLNGYISQFAEWRFTKYKLPVKMMFAEMVDFNLPYTFDVIFSDAVWEHLDPEMQIRYAEKLPSFLNNGGLFVLLIDLAGESAEMPMHYNVDIQAVHESVGKLCDCLYGKYQFASVWWRKR